MNSSKYKCVNCRDTGWIDSGNGYRQCECIEIEKARRIMANSGLKPDQRLLSINTYKPYDRVTETAKDICKKYIKAFDDIKESRRNGLALLGQPGSGKTHLIVSIATNLMNRQANPIPVVYMPYIETMQELKQLANVEEDYFRLANRYKGAKLLIIDDLFKDKVRQNKLIGELKEADMKHIYPIINYRYLNMLPTIISSECTPNMLRDLDGALAGRLLETSQDYLAVFSGEQYNFRLRGFKN